MMIIPFIFTWTLIMSLFIAMSSSSLFFLWISLEVNMMSFIPLMYLKNSLTMNSIVLYFLVQSFASSIYIFSISMYLFNPPLMKFLPILISLSMLMKLGAAPFHMWFPQVSEGLSFNSFTILLTIQKMIPLHILSIFKNNVLFISIILSALIGSLGGFNQFSLRKILSFSSISHLSWMLTLLMFNSNFWMIYLFIYSLIMKLMMFPINFYMMNYINYNKKINNNTSMLIIISFLSLGGMPPTMGFMMKWLSLKIIASYSLTMAIPLIISSLINLFFYLRLIYVFLLKNMINNKWEKSKSNKILMITIVLSLSIFLLISQI
uniref:NADH dehydrogenase subunit 2 n=1 Tax=Alectorobius peropteryx TaxID=1265610 RepID=UPI002238CC1D|nr:NADH dehydrogenase subunit 2 [Alectorobius peropteryx]UYB78496.1 NADH dehydrogenase subunit 2 [Alectorobius peropteryx]UYB78509.1 NADH dehydrogenase subunit 2 [Alectorobius peropteryx]